ncbi:P-loop containing nucleoside triphosphate hydrolase protein [Basidiobolus meristosporus CBS 931.73]|uniref:Structural maintenance of chromosomes protein 5 n=1 Tax=Basidiobolus meristosporus CBS 931.73 TaxID=1314790 RepID=A0A1Y1YDZ8_9FUNG|nr:P-loop containing nucleoside triphosphate hydrolase protein [Basidiobolus meristosporus CBS 931.73]|eukprot:ORX96250.1 P-loop containing nucleoside triphosphate hydrolase protein [Basidiobolus meristosporus CBS 931.73]
MSRKKSNSIHNREEESEEPVKRQRLSESLQRSSILHSEQDEYLEGSIVRVALKNFVTYDACEFFPGPNLNMIIGPNGTGKSTIVCAIALGLGGSPSLLGRAKEISEFVKHGHERASIEIELKGSPRIGNIIIKRQIKRSNNSSVWKINGQPATQKEILTEINALHIQVDNLCQFLPQDKVCEFAQMSPSELLKETQKAAGEEDLTDWHNKLIQSRNEEKQLQSSMKSEADHAENLEKRNAVLERDVVRFQEREKILRRVRLYEMRIPFARYGVAKQEYDIAKDERRLAHAEYQRILKENEPMEESKNELKRIVQKADNNRKVVNETFTRQTRQLKTKANEMEKMESEIDELTKDIADIKNREKHRKQVIVNLQSEIEALEVLVEREPPSADTSEIQPQIESVLREIRDVADKGNELQSDQEKIIGEGREINNQLNQLQQKLVDLEDIRNRRLDNLRLIDKDTYQATIWLRENRHRFEHHVFDPIALEINVKDMRYLNAIESAIGLSTFKNFVCQSKKDYDLFSQCVVDGLKLRVNTVMFGHLKLSNFNPPVPVSEAKRFGFSGYLLDFIDGPEPVLTALCTLSALHEIPVSLEEVNNDSVEGSRLFRSYIAGRNRYVIKYSQYGQKLPSVQSTGLRRGRLLSTSVSAEQRQQIENDINRFRNTLRENEAKVKELSTKYKQIRDRDQDLRKKRDKLQEEKKVLQSARKIYEKNKITLEQKKSLLIQKLEEPQKAQSEEECKRDKLHSSIRTRGQLALQYQELLQEISDLYYKRTLAALQYMQVGAELTSLEALCRERTNALRDATVRFKQANSTFENAKEKAKQLLAEANASIAEMDDDTKVEFQEFGKDMSLEELEDAIVSERAKADLNYATNPGILEAYNNRKKQIDQIKISLAEKEATLNSVIQRMEVLKSKWVPRISELVQRVSVKFSEAFDRIGCAGELKLSPNEDYDKWSIDILVKFRDHEKLQVLTGQRQSGGERSVSTILYLMALQELAKAPFRVVDEINQGMDPRNERMVHSQLVQVACQPNTSQYFLITPKLLPDLEYHERMKILCIYNGEWQPERFPIKSYIDNARVEASKA